MNCKNTYELYKVICFRGSRDQKDSLKNIGFMYISSFGSYKYKYLGKSFFFKKAFISLCKKTLLIMVYCIFFFFPLNSIGIGGSCGCMDIHILNENVPSLFVWGLSITNQAFHKIIAEVIPAFSLSQNYLQ